MKSHKRRVFGTVGATLAISLFISLALPLPRSLLLRAGMFLLVHHVERGQIRLLCKTDPQALLEACRELSKGVEAGDLTRDTYYFRSRKRAREISQFPKIILDLSPRYVSIDKDGRVVLQLGGGFANFGVFAYPEDYRERHRNFVYGNTLLSG